MPSFVCDTCQETLKKARLDDHVRRCSRASFSCIDCYKSFKHADEYRAHTSCITEVQKYEKKGMANKPMKSVDALNKGTDKKKRERGEDSMAHGEVKEGTSEKRSKKDHKKHKSNKHKHQKVEKSIKSVV